MPRSAAVTAGAGAPPTARRSIRLVAVVVLLHVVVTFLPMVTSQGDTCHPAEVDCTYPGASGGYLDGLTFDLNALKGPPSRALTTFVNEAANGSYHDIYFDFCREASGGVGTGGGNGDGDGSGAGDGGGSGNNGGSISDAIDAFCSDTCGYAYAVNSADNACHSLGVSVSITQLDPANPTLGVRMKYSGGGSGDTCSGGNSLTINLRCNAKHYVDVNVSQFNDCMYNANWYTPYGCPTQCLVQGGDGEVPSLCSGNGLCGYDYELGTSVCACYTGFSGTLCETAGAATEDSGIDGGMQFMISFVVLMLVGGLGFIGYMYWRLYKVQTAKARAAYDNLHAGRDASGNIQIHV